MQASRASSRALAAIAAGSKQSRSLHMTGPATFSSLLNSERPAQNLPRDLAGLRAECQKRKLPTSGTKDEVRTFLPPQLGVQHQLQDPLLTCIANQLTSRLSAHEVANSRSFSTAVQDSKRPVPTVSEAGRPIRHFNTSRSLKAVNDSSTIDFAYIPDFDPDAGSAPVDIRVPKLPQTVSSAPAPAADEVEEAVCNTLDYYGTVTMLIEHRSCCPLFTPLLPTAPTSTLRPPCQKYPTTTPLTSKAWPRRLRASSQDPLRRAPVWHARFGVAFSMMSWVLRAALAHRLFCLLHTSSAVSLGRQAVSSLKNGEVWDCLAMDYGLGNGFIRFFCFFWFWDSLLCGQHQV